MHSESEESPSRKCGVLLQLLCAFVRVETVKLSSAETAAGEGELSNSLVLVTQSKNSSCPADPCVPLLVPCYAAQCLLSA